MQLALLILCLQAGIGIVVISGLFGNSIHYENKITGISLPNQTSGFSDIEQTQTAWDIVGGSIDAISWGWIKDFFPFYYMDTVAKNIVDGIILFLRAATTIIIGAAAIEFMRNQARVLD